MFQPIQVIFTRTLVLLLLTIGGSGCDSSSTITKPAERPASVPTNALWVGGLDGGVYVLVTKKAEDKPPIYDATIYYSMGEIDYQGKLAINTPDNTTFDYKQVDSYKAWDGDTLYLSDGRFLKIVETIE